MWLFAWERRTGRQKTDHLNIQRQKETQRWERVIYIFVQLYCCARCFPFFGRVLIAQTKDTSHHTHFKIPTSWLLKGLWTSVNTFENLSQSGTFVLLWFEQERCLVHLLLPFLTISATRIQTAGSGCGAVAAKIQPSDLFRENLFLLTLFFFFFLLFTVLTLFPFPLSRATGERAPWVAPTDRETDLPPSDPSEPPADDGLRAAGAAGPRSEPGAPGRAAGTRRPHGASGRRQSQTVLPLMASALPLGRPALWPAHPAGTIWQVRKVLEIQPATLWPTDFCYMLVISEYRGTRFPFHLLAHLVSSNLTLLCWNRNFLTIIITKVFLQSITAVTICLIRLVPLKWKNVQYRCWGCSSNVSHNRSSF